MELAISPLCFAASPANPTSSSFLIHAPSCSSQYRGNDLESRTASTAYECAVACNSRSGEGPWQGQRPKYLTLTLPF